MSNPPPLRVAVVVAPGQRVPRRAATSPRPHLFAGHFASAFCTENGTSDTLTRTPSRYQNHDRPATSTVQRAPFISTVFVFVMVLIYTPS